MKAMEYSRTLPVKKSYFVLVAGGGPAGIAAAVAAARQGASVAVVERYGVVGGNLTSGYVGPIMGSVACGTLRDEMTGLLRVGFNDIQGKIGRVHDMEHAKGALLEFLLKEKVEVYLQRPVVDVVSVGRRIQGVVIAEKTGPAILKASTFVDATGDGDVAFAAGVDFEMGQDNNGVIQPVTLMYVLGGVEEPAMVCIGEEDDVQLNGERFLDFTGRCVAQGILPKHTDSVRLYRTNVPGERLVNTTQANAVNPLEAQDVVAAERVLREQITQVTEFLRRFVPGFQQCFIKTTASTLGVRESRRFKGAYVLNDDDLRQGRRFEDVVVHKANFVVDIHNPHGGGQAEGLAEVVQPYDIPYRCLLPQGVDNLLLTGRCISGTHRAHASYRIMTVCMALGEAAGIAAALSAQREVSPSTLGHRPVQEALLAKGAVLYD